MLLHIYVKYTRQLRQRTLYFRGEDSNFQSEPPLEISLLPLIRFLRQLPSLRCFLHRF